MATAHRSKGSDTVQMLLVPIGIMKYVIALEYITHSLELFGSFRSYAVDFTCGHAVIRSCGHWLIGLVSL